MKTIGLLGGMSWESTTIYYRLLNQHVKERLGGLHSAKCLLYSFDFEEVQRLQHQGQWEEAGDLLARTARLLEGAGADFLVICTNTMHKVAEQIQQEVSLPLLHIADATAERIRKNGLGKVGLLATGFTMEQDFYKGRLHQKYGLDVLVPEPRDREVVHQIIYQELCRGVIKPDSRQRYREIISRLVEQGAEAIILGCTEITLLVNQDDSPVPLFDTTAIHAEAAVDWALAVDAPPAHRANPATSA
ncbi:aspartate/glutamate racemase family protein [Brevibacillus humidisoli]|uniref:aspartate/glutamate racemase family protein n=1 Tax=Brevibacillus humidisoli TaxID=2895522 RepID=UPI001E5748A2|nr:aspartate/glutamate racemase family protein [Brevibacillus humidisoli]UFJ40809.1 aspartate/glutamate racemase family protein [Brevibacillus humidisoli]